ncbi:MAG TPA: hypothetical protein VKB49_30290 [Candidatus Sulfotelmatobacter sp.]|nr:hypothetical protein [Candidatus Sulfotelmatobacter sp.]
MRRRWYWIVPAAIIAIPLFLFIGGEVVMRLWNWLLPPLFGWRMLSFWQALGLLALCRILFGHHGGHRGFGPGRRWQGRCRKMTPEEREKFRQAMREGYDFGGSASSGSATQ